MEMKATEEPEAHKRGVQLEKEGKLEEALTAFSELESGDEYCRLAAGLCKGRILWRLMRLEEAAVAYRSALEIKPDSKVGTLGLYHSLMDSGKFDAAIEEAKRYFKDKWNEPQSDEMLEKYRVGNLALIGMDDQNVAIYRQQIEERAKTLTLEHFQSAD